MGGDAADRHWVLVKPEDVAVGILGTILVSPVAVRPMGCRGHMGIVGKFLLRLNCAGFGAPGWRVGWRGRAVGPGGAIASESSAPPQSARQWHGSASFQMTQCVPDSQQVHGWRVLEGAGGCW